MSIGGLNSNTVQYFRGDGVNSGTVFREGARGRIPTAGGAVQTRTDASCFGGTGIYLNGAGAYLMYVWSTLVPSYYEDFTLDLRFRTSQINSQMLWAQGQAGNPLVYFRLHNSNGVQFVVQSAVQFLYVATVYSAVSTGQSTFYHAAVTRASNVTRLFLNGVLCAQTNSIWAWPQDLSAHNTLIGAYAGAGPQQFFKGIIEEVRMVRGVAMWTEDFTPPDNPYTWENKVNLPIQGVDPAVTFKADASYLMTYGQRFKRDLVTKNVDLSADTIRCCLMSAGFVFDVDEHHYWSEVVGNELYVSRDTFWEEAGASHTSYLIKKGASTAVDSWVGKLSATGLSGLSTLSGGSYGVNRWGSNGVLYFDGASTGITISANTIAFGSRPFTIDYWLKMASIPAAAQWMMTHVHWVGASRRLYFGIYFSGTSTAYMEFTCFWASATVVNQRASFTTSYNVSNNLYSYWHYAVTRGDNGSFHFFVNGWSRLVNYVGVVTSAGYSIPTIGGSLLLHYNSQYFIKGNLEEYRVVVGECLWSENFTPPMSTITLSVVSYCGFNVTSKYFTEDDTLDQARLSLDGFAWEFPDRQSTQGIMLYDFNTSTIIGYISYPCQFRPNVSLVATGVTIKVG